MKSDRLETLEKQSNKRIQFIPKKLTT